MSLKNVVACLKRNKSFLITSHTSLEGDALGAELALYKLLKRLGKDVTIINEDKIPYGYNFLPGINNIKKFKGSQKNLRNLRIDCFALVDCSDLKRCGEVSKLRPLAQTTLNIDHHISNAGFGDVNWVEPGSSSASEMIYKLYKSLHIPFNREVATCLYVGILADTGSFRYSNTTSFSHQAAAGLLKFNLPVAEIYKNIYENIPFLDAELLSKILRTLRCQAEGKIAWLKVKRDMLKKRTISVDLSEQALSFARAIKEVEAVVLFKENLGPKNEVRVNFRSQGKIDVNKIAQFFGGGGHKTASGCTIQGNIDDIIRKVLKKVRESL